MRTIKHDQWLFLVLTGIGVLSLAVMGSINWYLGNLTATGIEYGVGLLGIGNLIYYFYKKNLALAGNVVLVVMFVTFVYLFLIRGIGGVGVVWVFTYPLLAFGLKNWVMASWYTSLFGLVLGGATVLEFFGYHITSYDLLSLVSVSLGYAVVALITSMSEHVHNNIEKEYLRQGKLLEEEKELISLRQNELRTFKAAISQSSEMMIITDPEGVVLWANEATLSITGFTPKESVGKKAGLLWGKLMDRDYYKKMWQVIKVEKQNFVSEIENHRKNGERFFSTIMIYPLLDRDGRIEYFVSTQRDITKAREIDQMKTDFISLVSHQLRTPLSSIRWNLEMLLNGDLGMLSPKSKKVVNQVESANKRMIKLIATLLNISRIESGRLAVDPKKIELKQYFKMIQKSRSAISRGQKLELSLPKHGLTVRVDTELITQVVDNLISNASKYSPKGSVITLSVRADREYYTVEVADQGYGIPKTDQRRIFGKFFRASNVTEYVADGTGMGLYIVKLIAVLLGGEVGFESHEGQGSRFWVTLPIKGVAAKAGEVRLG